MNKTIKYFVKNSVLAVLLFVNNAAYGQTRNLVPNPSFEDWLACPHGIADPIFTQYFPINYDPTYTFFRTIKNWTNPINEYISTPDYFNACSPPRTGVNVPLTIDGYQTAHTGVAYVGLALGTDTNGRFVNEEYVENKLTAVMQKDHHYRLSFYANRADNLEMLFGSDGNNVIAIDKLGAYFSDTLFYSADSTSLHVAPSVVNTSGRYIVDSINWIQIKGEYVAKGGEQWMTMGYFNDEQPYSYEYVVNFKKPYSATYVYIDDVCLLDLTDPATSRKDTTVCEASLPLGLHGDSSGNKYLWNTGDTTAYINVSAGGVYWVHTEGECLYRTDTIRVAIDTMTLSLPTAKNICQGDSVLLPASGAAVYSWSPAAGLSCSNCAAPLAAPDLSTTYTLVGSDAIGCIDTAQIAIAVDTAIASFSLSKDSLCQGDTLQISNAAQGKGLNYLWHFGDGDSATVPAPSYVYTQPGIYNISLVVTNLNCKDSTSQSVRIDTAGSYIGFTADTNGICAGETIHFMSTHGSGTADIIWHFGDGSDSLTGWEPSHAYDKSGMMIITATAYYHSCPALDFSDTIQVYPAPIVDIGRDSSLCPGQAPILLINHAAPEWQGYHLWSTGDSNNSIMVNTPAMYWLRLTSENGCSSIDSVTIDNSCYVHLPNAFTPNGDGLNDYFFPKELLSKGLNKFHMQVFNRWGQLIFETNSTEGRGWDGKWNGVLQPEGVYIYLIEAAFINNTVEKYKGNITLLP